MNAPPLTPETFQVPPIFALGAYHHPDGREAIGGLPHTVTSTWRSGCCSLATPPISPPASPGSATSGSATRPRSEASSTTTRRPCPSCAPASACSRAAPRSTRLPLPGRRHVRTAGRHEHAALQVAELRRGGGALRAHEAGRPYTTRESEVTDLTQLARTLFEAPADFIEQYFPTAILDGVGDPGSFPDLRYDGVAKRPALLIQLRQRLQQCRRRRRGAGRVTAQRPTGQPHRRPPRLQPHRRGQRRPQAERRPPGTQQHRAVAVHARRRGSGRAAAARDAGTAASGPAAAPALPRLGRRRLRSTRGHPRRRPPHRDQRPRPCDAAAARGVPAACACAHQARLHGGADDAARRPLRACPRTSAVEGTVRGARSHPRESTMAPHRLISRAAPGIHDPAPSEPRPTSWTGP